MKKLLTGNTDIAVLATNVGRTAIRWRKVGVIAALIVFMGGSLLFGAIKMIDTTQADTLDCERIRSECVPRGPKPICPNPNPKRIGSECVPQGPKPICPNPNLNPCPLDAAK